MSQCIVGILVISNCKTKGKFKFILQIEIQNETSGYLWVNNKKIIQWITKSVIVLVIGNIRWIGYSSCSQEESNVVVGNGPVKEQAHQSVSWTVVVTCKGGRKKFSVLT